MPRTCDVIASPVKKLVLIMKKDSCAQGTMVEGSAHSNCCIPFFHMFPHYTQTFLPFKNVDINLLRLNFLTDKANTYAGHRDSLCSHSRHIARTYLYVCDNEHSTANHCIITGLFLHVILQIAVELRPARVGAVQCVDQLSVCDDTVQGIAEDQHKTGCSHAVEECHDGTDDHKSFVFWICKTKLPSERWKVSEGRILILNFHNAEHVRTPFPTDIPWSNSTSIVNIQVHWSGWPLNQP